MPTKKRVDIGMIGAGWWPNTMHMPALAACDLANVVAVCDLIPERADVLAQKYDIPYNFTDYKELLASGLCEAVVVATTNDSHYPITMDVLPQTAHRQGYLGRPYHLHMRYYAAFTRGPEAYLWRFERKIAGSGALADIGSYFLNVAEWFYGEIEAVVAQLSALVKRSPNPQGESYEQADDTAMVMLRFKNGRRAGTCLGYCL